MHLKIHKTIALPAITILIFFFYIAIYCAIVLYFVTGQNVNTKLHLDIYLAFFNVFQVYLHKS